MTLLQKRKQEEAHQNTLNQLRMQMAQLQQQQHQTQPNAQQDGSRYLFLSFLSLFSFAYVFSSLSAPTSLQSSVGILGGFPASTPIPVSREAPSRATIASLLFCSPSLLPDTSHLLSPMRLYNLRLPLPLPLLPMASSDIAQALLLPAALSQALYPL